MGAACSFAQCWLCVWELWLAVPGLWGRAPNLPPHCPEPGVSSAAVTDARGTLQPQPCQLISLIPGTTNAASYCWSSGAFLEMIVWLRPWL